MPFRVPGVALRDATSSSSGLFHAAQAIGRHGVAIGRGSALARLLSVPVRHATIGVVVRKHADALRIGDDQCDDDDVQVVAVHQHHWPVDRRPQLGVLDVASSDGRGWGVDRCPITQ